MHSTHTHRGIGVSEGTQHNSSSSILYSRLCFIISFVLWAWSEFGSSVSLAGDRSGAESIGRGSIQFRHAPGAAQKWRYHTENGVKHFITLH